MNTSVSYESPNKWNFYPGSPEIEEQTLFTPDRRALNGEHISASYSPGVNSVGHGTPNKWTMYPEEEIEDAQLFTPDRMTLKERFEYNRRMEKRMMEEKLKAVRHNLGEPSRHIVEANVWGEVMKDKKAREEEKMKASDNITPSRKHIEEAAEVKKALARMTDVFMQREPTKSEIYEVFHAANEACVGFDPNVHRDIHNVQSSNIVTYLNTTHIYTVDSLNAKGYQIINSLLEPETTLYRPVSLLCGVFAEHGCPELRPVAIAFKLDSKSLLIALRITVSAGYPENAAYGLRKIGVYHADKSNLIFERVINLLPEPVTFDADELPVPSGNRHAYFANTSDNPNAHHHFSGNDLLGKGGKMTGNFPVEYGFNDTNNNDRGKGEGELNEEQEEVYGYREGDDPEEASQDGEEYDHNPVDYDHNGGGGGVYGVMEGYHGETRDYYGSIDALGVYEKRHNVSYDEAYRSGGGDGGRRAASRDEYDDGRGRDRRDYDDDRSYSSRTDSRSRSGSDDSHRSYSDDQDHRGGGGGGRDDHRRDVSQDSFDYDDEDRYTASEVRYANTNSSSSRGGSVYSASTRTNPPSSGPSMRSSTNYYDSPQPQVTRGGGFDGGSSKYSDSNNNATNSKSVSFKGGNAQEGDGQWASRVSQQDTPKKGLPYVIAPSDTKFSQNLPSLVPSSIVTEGILSSNRLSEVKTVSGATDMLVLGLESGSVFLQEPSLQPASSSAITVLSNGKIFQWIKGIYMKGWLLKWPTKNQQSMGRLAKRYFVLKDNVLSYHKTEIEDDDDMLATPQTKFFRITADCQVKIGMHNMQRCMKIITATEKIWVALNGENEMEIETRWVTALNNAIAAAEAELPPRPGVTSTSWSVFQPSSSSSSSSSASAATAAALQMLKPTAPPADFTYKWYLTDPTVSIISADGLALRDNGGFVRVGLYEQAGVATMKKGVLERRNVYSVDIGTDAREKMHLQVVLTNESPVLQSDLTCVKLFGDMLIFGGKQGFVGVGSVGLTTGVAEGVSRKVVYSISCKQGGGGNGGSGGAASASSNRNIAGAIAGAYPHSSAGSVTALAAGKRCNIFAAADSQGVVSLWYLNKDDDNLKYDKSPSKTNLGFYYKIKPALQATVNLTFLKTNESMNALVERVVHMEFFNCDRYLVVHTNKRLVLLVLSYPAQNPNYLFDAWVEVDRVTDPATEARFAFVAEESETRQHGEIYSCASKIVHWRVCESSTPSAASSSRKGAKCSIVKTEWTRDQFMRCVNKIKYL